MDDLLKDAATHYPVLAAAVLRTTGPVLECGMGDFSSPILHLMLKGSGRPLVSCETDPDWYGKFKHYASPDHLVLKVDSWEDVSVIEKMKWGCALIDHSPGDRRIKEVMRLKGRCKFIVCHDTEEMFIPNYASDYRWREVVDKFKYATTYKEYCPYTTVLSDEEAFVL